MMNKNLCFVLEDKELFLEAVLVEYNKTPIYFLCSDLSGAYYTILCSDIDNEEYIIVQSSESVLLDLFDKKLDMRGVITRESEYWHVSAGDSVEYDIVSREDTSSIDQSILPYEDSFFEITEKEISDFVLNLKQGLVVSSSYTEQTYPAVTCMNFFEGVSTSEDSYTLQFQLKVGTNQTSINNLYPLGSADNSIAV